MCCVVFFFFQAEDGIRDLVRSRGLGDVYKRQALQNAFKNKKQQFEFWGKRKNGEGFLKDVRLYPGKFFNRNVVIAVARDITKEKEAEIALRNSEERYKLIAENTIDSIAVFDLNLNYTYLSPSVKKLLGYTPEELANIGLFKILTPKSAEYVSQLVSNELFKVRSGNNNLTSNIVVETQQYTKDGSIIWVESSLSVLRDATGTPTGILAVSRDVTARKKVEAALAESEERYRTISSLTSDYLFSTSIDEYGNQQLVWVAGSFEKITGYTMQEYISAGGWKVKLHEEDIEKDISDICLLYTSDAADERSSVDLGGRRIIKKKKNAHKGEGQDERKNKNNRNAEHTNTIQVREETCNKEVEIGKEDIREKVGSK